MRGNYCSFNCACADVEDCGEMAALHVLHRDMTGVDCKIHPAPPRSVLIDFGGHMTIGDFRSGSITGYIMRPHMIPAGQVCVTNHVLSSLGTADVEDRATSAVMLDKRPVQGKLF
jgi:hypothetical protein